MDFAKLMSKAKANTAQANVLVQSKQAEAEAARKAEAEKARRLELQEAERKKREVEARLRREHEQRLLHQRLQEEKEKKRLEKAVTTGDDSDEGSSKGSSRKTNGQASSSKHTAGTGPSRNSSTRLPPMNAAERKKRKRMESLFSDDDEDGSDASGRRHGTKGKGKERTGPGSSASAALKRKAASGTDLLSAKERALLEFDPAEAMKLNVNKRDTRTIEEIEADMRSRKRKEAEEAGLVNGPAANASTSTGMFANRKGQSSMAIASGRSTPIKAATPDLISKPAKVRRSESPKPTKKASVASSIKPAPATKKQRSYSPPAASSKGNPNKSKQMSRSEEIWKIMYPNRPYRPAIDYDSDDIDRSDDDDMEAGYDEIEEEDRAADRAAKREDKAELERLEKRALEKQKLKAQKAGLTSGR